LAPYQQKYGHYLLNMKPWKEFFWPLSNPNGEACNRLSVNLIYFQINYALVFGGFMVWSIFAHPKSLALMCVLAVAWVFFLKKNADPEWVLEVGGLTLGPTQRWTVLCTITALSTLVFASQVITSAAIMCAIFVAVHGMLHSPPAVAPEARDIAMASAGP
jgi:hypothetical protein